MDSTQDPVDEGWERRRKDSFVSEGCESGTEESSSSCTSEDSDEDSSPLPSSLPIIHTNGQIYTYPDGKAGMATCEMCGMVGVRDAFYSKTKRFCSVSCSRSFSSNSKKASIMARLQGKPPTKKAKVLQKQPLMAKLTAHSQNQSNLQVNQVKTKAARLVSRQSEVTSTTVQMSTASRRRKDPGSVTASQSQNTVSAAPNASHEIELLKLQLEAEKDKGILREETIKILKQDKEHLQSQLSKKEEFIQELIRSKMEEIPGPSNILETKVKAHPKHQMPEKPVESDGGTSSSVLSDSSVEVTKTKRKTPESKPDFHRVRVKNTRSIIARYKTALGAFKKGSSMKAAIDSVGLDRATIACTAVVAELKIAAPELFDGIAPWNKRVEKLSVFVERCRAEVTSDVKSKICQMKIDGELLPIATTF